MAPERAVFQLRKYSWADDKSADGRTNYTHIVADNLCLVLEGSGALQGALSLCVVQATTVKEDIDLALHIDNAIGTRQTFLEAGRHVPDRQLPAYAVSSGLKLAITYRRDNGKVHRMQIAFDLGADCARVVALLKCRGMVFVEPIRSSNPQTEQGASHRRPTTASTTLTRMLDSATSDYSLHNSIPHVPSSIPFFRRDQQATPREFALEGPSPARTFHSAIPNRQTMNTLSSLYPQPLLSNVPSTTPSDLHSGSTTTEQDSAAHSTVWSSLPPPRQLPFDSDKRVRSSSSSALSLPALPVPRPSSNGASAVSSSTRGKKRTLDDIQEVEATGEADMPPPTGRPSTRPRSSLSRSSNSARRRGSSNASSSKAADTAARLPLTTREPATVAEGHRTAQRRPQISAEMLEVFKDSGNLAEYVKLDDKGRQGALEQFIISVLHDENFKKLCEDMSVCWQRVAVGM